jgi:hypothetical protein
MGDWMKVRSGESDNGFGSKARYYSKNKYTTTKKPEMIVRSESDQSKGNKGPT